MRLSFVLIILSLGALSHALPFYTGSAIAPVSSLAPWLGFPSCILECSRELLQRLDDVVTNRISKQLFDDTCSAYMTSASCVTSASNCSAHQSLYDDLTSGLQYACVKERVAFRNVLPCVEVKITRREESVDCESQCRLNESISSMTSSVDVQKRLIEGGQALDLLPYAGSLCKSISCYLKCSRAEMNSYCGSSGSMLVEMVLLPFKRLSRQFQVASPKEYEELHDSMDESCRQFFIEQKMDSLIFDQGFLDKLAVLTAARKKFQLVGRLDDSDYEVFRKLMVTTTPASPLHGVWDLSAILYLVFMFLTLALVIVGLCISVIWCCRSEEMEQASMHQFQQHLHREQVRVIFKAAEQTIDGTTVKED